MTTPRPSFASAHRFAKWRPVFVHSVLTCLLLFASVWGGPAAGQDQESQPLDVDLDEPLPEWVDGADREEERRRFYASIGFGLDFTRGDYGEPEMTKIGSVPAFLKLEWEPITFRISVPFTVIDGSENVLGGENPEPTGDSPATRRDYGLGDIVTSLAYTYYPRTSGAPIFDFIGKVKIPTADANLGTGKTDVTLQFELTEIVGPVALFGGFGYRFKGGADYEDILLASAGCSLRFSPSFSAGVAYDWRQASVPGASDSSHELSPYLSLRVGEHGRIGPYAVIGLSQYAPDWGVGSSFSYEF